MAYTFIQELIPRSKYPRKAPYAMTPTTITIHNTANDAPAINENRYMASNNNYVSYHTAIDDKYVRQAIPYNRSCYAAGDGVNGKGNRTSIHIEICYSKSGGLRYTQAEENAVQYVATLLKGFGWGVGQLRQHFDWSKKNCPHRIRDEGRWQSFIARVQDALDKLNNKTLASKRPSKDVIASKIGVNASDGANVYRLQSGRYNTLEDAQKALNTLLSVGAISYGTILTFTDGYRIESGAYRGAGDATQALNDARTVAENAIANGHLSYVTIVGYEE